MKPTYEPDRKVLLSPDGLGMDTRQSSSPPPASINQDSWSKQTIQVDLWNTLPDSSTDSLVAKSSIGSSSSTRYERGGTRRSRKRELQMDLCPSVKKHSSQVDRTDEEMMKEYRIDDLEKENAQLKESLKRQTEENEKIDELNRLLKEEVMSRCQISEELEQTKKKLGELTKLYRNLQLENSAMMNDRARVFERYRAKDPPDYVDPRRYMDR